MWSTNGVVLSSFQRGKFDVSMRMRPRLTGVVTGSRVACARVQTRAHHANVDLDSRRRKAAKIIALLDRQRPLAGARILDVGTGAGVIASELARAAGPEAAGLGVSGRSEGPDIDATFARFWKARTREEAAKRVWDATYRGSREARRFIDADFIELKAILTELGLAR